MKLSSAATNAEGTRARGRFCFVKPGQFASVDEYMDSIENLSFRSALEDLRKLIKEELPDAEEKISYGMPTYKLNSNICHFAAFAKHCSFFPGGVALEYAEELVGYKLSKGNIQFSPEKPMDPELVRKMVRRNKEADAAKAKGKNPKNSV